MQPQRRVVAVQRLQALAQVGQADGTGTACLGRGWRAGAVVGHAQSQPAVPGLHGDAHGAPRGPRLHRMLERVLQQRLQRQRGHRRGRQGGIGIVDVPVQLHARRAEALLHQTGIAAGQRQFVGQRVQRPTRHLGGGAQQLRQAQQRGVGRGRVVVHQRGNGVERVVQEVRLHLLRQLRQPRLGGQALQPFGIQPRRG